MTNPIWQQFIGGFQGGQDALLRRAEMQWRQKQYQDSLAQQAFENALRQQEHEFKVKAFQSQEEERKSRAEQDRADRRFKYEQQGLPTAEAMMRAGYSPEEMQTTLAKEAASKDQTGLLTLPGYTPKDESIIPTLLSLSQTAGHTPMGGMRLAEPSLSPKALGSRGPLPPPRGAGYSGAGQMMTPERGAPPLQEIQPEYDAETLRTRLAMSPEQYGRRVLPSVEATLTSKATMDEYREAQTQRVLAQVEQMPEMLQIRANQQQIQAWNITQRAREIERHNRVREGLEKERLKIQSELGNARLKATAVQRATAHITKVDNAEKQAFGAWERANKARTLAQSEELKFEELALKAADPAAPDTEKQQLLFYQALAKAKKEERIMREQVEQEFNRQYRELRAEKIQAQTFTSGSGRASSAAKQDALNAVGGKPLDKNTARAILKEAGGNQSKAEEIARKRGYQF